MIPTHSIIFRPIDKYGNIDFKRNDVILHSDQVKDIHISGKTWVFTDYLNHQHLFNRKYWTIIIGVLKSEYLFPNP